MTILVTGGAGYVGSHVVHALTDAGRGVVVVDNMRTGSLAAVPSGTPVHIIDVTDTAALEQVIRDHGVTACIHLAGLKNPGESMKDPGLYFHNNATGTLSVLNALVGTGVRDLVFSSSCSVYGAAEKLPITEDSPLQPISPYGHSKLVGERMIEAYGNAHGLRWMSLRYFNAAGAALDGSIGEDWGPTHNLVPLLAKAALGARPPVTLFGSDYPTEDGTAVRDYTHVVDLAEAHVLALGHLQDGGSSAALNLGTGTGYSVLQVVKGLEQVAGRPLPVTFGERRPGDPPVVWADPARASEVLGWRARFGLAEILATAWQWHARSHLVG
ncbi:UDP-glucose 4-epimerase GalE [Lentzea sp. NEAU-D13]|uniref:UDP-glucose 4-epimerase n=1 Tax=Lentzea alba TaxID=2714351 RepID=A0A7C9VXT9_9PSEU|nr:UDP-glucose 4-epimerase GalE [Lentzea alba]NGY61761.1 UDP-glucose 4-epimerase GalE [Lentzea alba]